MDTLRMHLISFVAHATGGSVVYTGRDMKSSHAGLDVTEAEWAAAGEDMAATLDARKVPAAEKAELLALIGTLKAGIVTKK